MSRLRLFVPEQYMRLEYSRDIAYKKVNTSYLETPRHIGHDYKMRKIIQASHSGRFGRHAHKKPKG